MTKDPLQLLFNIKKPDIEQINKIVVGSRQLAVLLNNNNLGSCTTLGNKLFATKDDLFRPDFLNISHRALLIAYYNAFYNYSTDQERYGDISEIIDFNNYSNIVMIGFFRTLVEKIDANHIPLNVFDLDKNDNRLTGLQHRDEFVTNADAIIITATTLLNNTLVDIISKTNKRCDIFLLGPSSTMSRQLFYITNLKYIFGSVYKDTEKVLKAIEDGGGIKDIMRNMKKIYLKRP